MKDLFKTYSVVSKPSKLRELNDEERSQYHHRNRLRQIDEEIAKLRHERKEISLKVRYGAHARQGTPYCLYALLLEDGKYYVGFTTDAEKRFKKHLRGKGALWTKKYKPIEIIEVRDMPLDKFDDVAFLEDDMTVEYAMRYGSENVRGGGYCQVLKPKWPQVVIQNERSY